LSDPELFRSIREPARIAALKALKITKEYGQLQSLEEQISTLENELGEKVSALYQTLYGKESSRYSARNDIDSIISKQRERQEEKLLLKSKVGREIAQLREEKENLLDTVWLATSPRQVTELWENLSALIGDEATPFQQDVLTRRTKAKKA